jgi:alginate O-acetyltransferase complex protein AlgI
MAWVLFRADTISFAWSYYGVLFGQSDAPLDMGVLNQFLNREFIFYFIISLLSAAGMVVKSGVYLERLTIRLQGNYPFIAESSRIIQSVFLLLILAACSMYLITTTYNPFIYYRF